ncbi:hypothetical protein HanIR_Chr09g0418431 [Helianthus annuus]|nr:hypothetical protein HanIR_Chr09g0418431 [Helianthus annuus]
MFTVETDNICFELMSKEFSCLLLDRHLVNVVLVDLTLWSVPSEEDDVSRCSQLSNLLPLSLTIGRI